MDQKERRAKRWAFLRRTPRFLNLFEAPTILRRIGFYIKQGHYVTDLGCGWGYYTFLLADLVGENGKVYAIDLGEKCIHTINKKAVKRGFISIEGHATTAANLHFIPDASMDFVLANGLFCSMENDRMVAVDEIRRILKPSGYAYVSLGAAPPLGLMDENEWNEMLTKFTIQEGGNYQDLWVVLSG